MQHTFSTSTFVLVITGQAFAGISVFTDRASWELAVGAPIATEDFNAVAEQDFSGSSLSTPLLTVFETPNPDATSSAEIVAGGSFSVDGTTFIDVNTGPMPGNVVGFNGFAGGNIFAWAADFADPFSGPGVDIVVGDDRIPTDLIPGIATGFIGFVLPGASASEVTIEFNGSGGGVLELYGIDNVSFAVPSPGAAVLMGLAGIAGVRRRRA